MKNKFLSFLQKESNITYTENNNASLKTTYTHLTHLFGTIGALRFQSDEKIEGLFQSAFDEDPLLAVKMAFYARNIRGGIGERRTFRTILKYLAVTHPEIVEKNLDAIALFGRYDDFYALIDTPVEPAMWHYLKVQLTSDIVNCDLGKPVSLLAKWLKSVNASSEETNALGKLTAHQLGFSERTYRKTLSQLRAHLNLTETKMSSRSWSDIVYSNVPSHAMSLYHRSFKAHDEDRFNEYIESLQVGKEKTPTALFPYDLMEKMGLSPEDQSFTLTHSSPLLEAKWDHLPNLIDRPQNILVMADTSGSMYGRPLCFSIGLAIYFAQHNTGAFKNIFMTFSNEPSLIELKGLSLKEQVKCITAIIENTNLESAFNLLLKVAVTNRLNANELPKSILVISDMAFDSAVDSDWTFYEELSHQYSKRGYQIPNIIFWNVSDKNQVFQATSDFKGVQLASGHSPAVFKSILANIGKTPYDAMLDTLSSPIYDCITL